MLVRIEHRMGETLRRSLSAEDIWQETLLHAWRDRGRCVWTGVSDFRGWLLQIAVNRIRDAADRMGAEKRGGPAAIGTTLPVGSGSDTSSPGFEALVFHSTTPSRVAQHREQADAMRAAVESLPELLREVVRLRLFEEHSPDEIARELDLSTSAVKHRLRRGSAVYRERLAAALALRRSSFPAKS